MVTLAYGHGVALELAYRNGLTPQGFARVHPAGSLGKNLLLTVDQCMITGSALPLLNKDDSFATVLSVVSRGYKGIAIVVSSKRVLLGVITDGDVRRAAEAGPAVFLQSAHDIMSDSPHNGGTKAQQALKLMYDNRITNLIVVDNNNSVCGLVHVHDLVAAGVSSHAIIKESV